TGTTPWAYTTGASPRIRSTWRLARTPLPGCAPTRPCSRRRSMQRPRMPYAPTPARTRRSATTASDNRSRHWSDGVWRSGHAGDRGRHSLENEPDPFFNGAHMLDDVAPAPVVIGEQMLQP